MWDELSWGELSLGRVVLLWNLAVKIKPDALDNAAFNFFKNYLANIYFA